MKMTSEDEADEDEGEAGKIESLEGFQFTFMGEQMWVATDIYV